MKKVQFREAIYRNLSKISLNLLLTGQRSIRQVGSLVRSVVHNQYLANTQSFEYSTPANWMAVTCLNWHVLPTSAVPKKKSDQTISSIFLINCTPETKSKLFVCSQLATDNASRASLLQTMARLYTPTLTNKSSLSQHSLPEITSKAANSSLKSAVRPTEQLLNRVRIKSIFQQCSNNVVVKLNVSY